jgi:hypothetical protein
MAQNLVVNFIGNNKLSKTTAVVVNDFKKLTNATKTLNGQMSKTLGAVGLGLGFAKLAGFMRDSAKAASEDIKSQALLSNSLRNTVKATDGTIASAEAYIKKTQLSASVLDDELRPALAKTVLATGSLSAGQKLLDTALNVSAGTGKGLDVVTSALSKAYNGQTTALKKLVPGISLTGDVMARLDEKFANASATAAKNDPYKRLGIIFQDLQETIGVTLLPAIEQFSTYLASPQGQSNLQQIADLFKVIGSIIVDTTKFLLDNIVVIKAVLAAIIFVKLAWGAVAGAVRVYTFVTSLATAQTKLLKVALLSTGIGAIAVAVGVLAESWMGAADAQQTYVDGAPLGPEWDYLDPKKNGFLNPIPEDSDAWLLLGYETYGTYLGALNEAYLADKNKKSVAAKKVEDMGKEIRRALDNEISKMKSTAEKFRDTIGLAFGTFGKDENSVFNIDVVIAKMKRVVAAAKGFTENLKKLREKGVKENTINEIIAMGPAQGNIVAKGLLASGSKLGTFLGLSESLYTTGAGAQAQASLAGNATYEININKAVITASDIIKEIRIYEKKTGRKYLVN